MASYYRRRVRYWTIMDPTANCDIGYRSPPHQREPRAEREIWLIGR